MSKLSCLLTLLSCRRYTELASRAQDCQLPWHERMMLSAHHALCMVCRRFSRQMKAIDRAATQINENTVLIDNEFCMDEKCRHRIEKKIIEELKENP
jgi:hypothetical protein